MEKNSQYDGIYLPYIIKWGRITGWLGVLLSFGPALVLAVVYKLMPPVSAIITAFIAIASAVGINWVVEPISYFPIVGVPGTYMAFITGNISNLRIPAAAVSQNVAGVEPGTKEGTIIATLGMATSVIVNIVILALGVFAGTAVLESLPESVVASFNFLLPALFGAIFIQFALKKLKLAPIALGIALVLTFALNSGVFSFLPGKPSYIVTLGAVFGTIGIGTALYKKKLI
ncbi:hypothetical protein KQI41_00375 [Tissierella pigra]|uniref:Small-conductance mechanosensitive channel n=1 Tax=Tissierella pigra TaxID=2607614 RepID=A0A6N7XKZ1_9FIRM|nr:hypothetical protein [Tissierella pigra]MBU5424847.1 hypothetical protein [Tissierella pigra]MSU02246.1 hypothetical protein [Tissierella pigra]